MKEIHQPETLRPRSTTLPPEIPVHAGSMTPPYGESLLSTSHDFWKWPHEPRVDPSRGLGESITEA